MHILAIFDGEIQKSICIQIYAKGDGEVCSYGKIVKQRRFIRGKGGQKIEGCKIINKNRYCLSIYHTRYYLSKLFQNYIMIYHQLLYLLLLFSLVSPSNMPQPKDFTIVKAQKQVNLNAQYPTQTTKIQFRCLLNICPLSFRHIIPVQYDAKVVKIAFGKDKNAADSFTYSKGIHQHVFNGAMQEEKEYAVYDIKISEELVKDETSLIYVVATYVNRYVNFPQSITLSEDQKLQYEDNKYFLSIYDVFESNIAYKFTKLLSFDEDGEKKGLSSVSFKKTEYPSYMTDKHIIHGVNNQPQVVFTQVQRIIQISHWGNIAITQFYKIKNTGPSLKGEFSRIQFSSQNKFEAKNAFRGIETQLPYKTWGLYYRDEVGNISTSKAFRDDRNEFVKFALVPRYALLGGWKANWEIGYNLNTEGFLRVDQNHFELSRIPLGYALDKVLTESYSIKVILPEDCTNTQVYIGGDKIDMKSVENGVSFGYLDFTGRPSFKINDLKGSFDQKKLTVTYDQNPSAILKKPFYLFGAIFSVLILIIVVKRLNFSAFEDHSKLQ